MVYTLRQSAIMLHDGHREQQPTLRQVVSLVRALSHRDFSYYIREPKTYRQALNDLRRTLTNAGYVKPEGFTFFFYVSINDATCLDRLEAQHIESIVSDYPLTQMVLQNEIV